MRKWTVYTIGYNSVFIEAEYIDIVGECIIFRNDRDGNKEICHCYPTRCTVVNEYLEEEEEQEYQLKRFEV